MKDGGATKSQFGSSTVRSGGVMSSVSRAPSSVSRSMSRQQKKTARPGTGSTRPDTAMSSVSGGSSITLGSEWGVSKGPARVPGGMKSGLLPTNRGRAKMNLKVRHDSLVWPGPPITTLPEWSGLAPCRVSACPPRHVRLAQAPPEFSRVFGLCPGQREAHRASPHLQRCQVPPSAERQCF